MGIAIIINGANFSAKNLGKVNIIQDVDVESMNIMGEDSYEASSFQLGVSYLPLNTNQKGVTWEITSGGQYATIDTASGVVTILDGANNNNIVVKATNTYNPSVTATKTISVKYKATLDVLNSISVIGDSTINDQTHQFSVEFDPTNTSYNSVTWAITNGSQYGTISQDGLLTINEGTTAKSMTIRATSTHDTSIYGEKTSIVTYSIPPIRFADPAFKAVCVAKADKDGDGEVSRTEAAALTGMCPNTAFKGLTCESADELQYFGWTSFGYWTFADCNIGSITLPSGTTSINQETFTSASVVDTIDFNGSSAPISIKYIGSLKRVIGVENVTNINSIGNSANVGLQYIAPLESLTSVDGAAMKKQSEIDNLVIGNGTNELSLAWGCFQDLSSLRYVILNIASLTSVANDSFGGLPCNVYVKDSSYDSVAASLNGKLPSGRSVKRMSEFATDFPSETETINWINKW